MGADFILSRLDDALDSIRYVGIIAKTGGIRQDHSSIDRQINECAVPRLFQVGKKRIRLDEIWVIVTGTVTQNAQDKIHETYRLRNIQFINGAKLETLVDRHLPVFWSGIPLEIGGYLSNLRPRSSGIRPRFKPSTSHRDTRIHRARYREDRNRTLRSAISTPQTACEDQYA